MRHYRSPARGVTGHGTAGTKPIDRKTAAAKIAVRIPAMRDRRAAEAIRGVRGMGLIAFEDAAQESGTVDRGYYCINSAV